MNSRYWLREWRNDAMSVHDEPGDDRVAFTKLPVRCTCGQVHPCDKTIGDHHTLECPLYIEQDGLHFIASQYESEP